MELLARALHWMAVAASVMIAGSWLIFATSEVNDAALGQQKAVADAQGRIEELDAAEAARKAEQGTWRGSTLVRTVEQVSEQLESPFQGIVKNQGTEWSKRTISAVIALLAFGVGFEYGSRWIRMRA